MTTEVSVADVLLTPGVLVLDGDAGMGLIVSAGDGADAGTGALPGTCNAFPSSLPRPVGSAPVQAATPAISARGAVRRRAIRRASLYAYVMKPTPRIRH